MSKSQNTIEVQSTKFKKQNIHSRRVSKSRFAFIYFVAVSSSLCLSQSWYSNTSVLNFKHSRLMSMRPTFLVMRCISIIATQVSCNLVPKFQPFIQGMHSCNIQYRAPARSLVMPITQIFSNLTCLANKHQRRP